MKRQYVQICAKVTSCDNSGSVSAFLKLMFNLCALGGDQRAICPGMRHTACCVIAQIPFSSEKELGMELDVNVDEEHWIFVVVLLPSAMN